MANVKTVAKFGAGKPGTGNTGGSGNQGSVGAGGFPKNMTKAKMPGGTVTVCNGTEDCTK